MGLWYIVAEVIKRPEFGRFRKISSTTTTIEIPNSKSNRLIESMLKNNSMLPDFELIRN